MTWHSRRIEEQAMWARTTEVMLGAWLAASPFIFRHSPEEPLLWWNDLGSALLVVTLSLLSFWSRMRRAHLLNILVALWLVGFAYFGFGSPPPPAAQNDLVVGLLLLMLAIIPSQATLPPRGWRERMPERNSRHPGSAQEDGSTHTTPRVQQSGFPSHPD
jgi:hypothetical protein